MKIKINSKTREKYMLPSRLTDFQLKMYIHLIEWKWKHITRKSGTFKGIEYGALLPEEFKMMKYPFYQPLVEELSRLNFKTHTHFGHMASSQAACLNLFVPILRNKSIADQILSQVNKSYKELAVGELDGMGYRFEFWDQSNPLKDHTDAAGTDADVAIAYYNISGELCLWLIEHKLTEEDFTTCGGYRSLIRQRNNKVQFCNKGQIILKDHSKCYYQYKCGYKYWEITDRSKLYDILKLQISQRCPFIAGENQLWRNQLLAYAIKEKGHFKNVQFSVVHHPENRDLENTIKRYRNLLKDNNIFDTYTLRDFVEAASIIREKCIEDWIEWYKSFYMI